jgi:hypothetical protein
MKVTPGKTSVDVCARRGIVLAEALAPLNPVR